MLFSTFVVTIVYLRFYYQTIKKNDGKMQLVDNEMILCQQEFQNLPSQIFLQEKDKKTEKDKSILENTVNKFPGCKENTQTIKEAKFT